MRSKITVALGSLFIVIIGIFLTPSLKAQEYPLPRTDSNRPIPCNQDSDLDTDLGTEFQSLRPYQASTCNPQVSDTALFCGNDIYFTDKITVRKQWFMNNGRVTAQYFQDVSPMTPLLIAPVCRNPYSENGVVFEDCTLTVERSKDIAIDMSKAYLPIMGYSEPSYSIPAKEDIPKVVNTVINEQPFEEDMTDAVKMGEYVSWYLNGVVGRAEYPYLDVEKNCLGLLDQPGVCRPRIGNTLLCSANPFDQISGKGKCTGNDFCCVNITQVATGKLDRDTLINYSGPVKKLLPQRIQEDARNVVINEGYISRNDNAGLRHDQVVGCILNRSFHIRICIPFTNVCLVDQDVDFGGVPIPCYGAVAQTASFFKALRGIHLSQWIDRMPPRQEDYADFQDYYVAYQIWRGNFCFGFIMPESVAGRQIPIIGGKKFMLCGDNPLSPNFWSNLYNYIPFSSTEDRRGKVEVNDQVVQPQQPGARVIWTRFIESAGSGILFFPHMEDATKTGELLQKTYAYQGANLNSPVTDTQMPEYCDLTMVRTNPGDSLFAGEIRGTLNYQAEITCKFLHEYGPNAATSAYDLFGNLCRNTDYPELSTPAPGGLTCVNNPDLNTRYDYCEVNYGDLDCDTTRADFVGCARNCHRLLDYPTGPRNSEMEPTACSDAGLATATPYRCVPNRFSCSTIWEGTDPASEVCDSGFKCASINTCHSPVRSPFPMYQDCEVNFLVRLGTNTLTPKAGEVWSRLVAGETGIFKRIFPKITWGAPVEALIDIPASSPVVFTSLDGTPIWVGSPGQLRSPEGAELYFAHIGGVYEYFLHGIQTALRPKGYGYSIASGTPTELTGGVCDGKIFELLEPLPGLSALASGEMRQIIIGGRPSQEVQEAYKLAEETTGVACEILAGIHFREGGSNPNQNLQNGGALHGTLADSAIQAARELKAKAGLNPYDRNVHFTSIDQLVMALSYYNGGGNANCQSHDTCAGSLSYCSCFDSCDQGNTASCVCPASLPCSTGCRGRCGSGYHYDIPYNNCPVHSTGWDDPYVINHLAPSNSLMYLLFMYDCTQSPPIPLQSPGAFAFAIGLYLNETNSL